MTLRTELLLSHAGLVCCSMLIFGTLLFAVTAHTTYRNAESDLLAAAQELVQHLRREPDATQLEISNLYRHRFGMAPRDHAYFAIWDRSGKLLFSTPHRPPHAQPSAAPPPTAGPHPFHTRSTGGNHDVIVATPQGGQLLIGRPLAKEWDGLRWLIIRMLALGTVCLAGGIAIAVWLSRRLAAPLDRLTSAAERITSRNLHERIPVSHGSREVVRLGQVFNQMMAGLQSAFETQTRFIADASHELRTPVTVVLSQAEHALHRERTAEQYRQALDVCLRASRRLKGLIDALLFLSRADAGKLGLRLGPVDLAHITVEALELLAPLAAEHAVQLRFHPVTATLEGDADRLAQVVTNLVTNAIRYNRPQGHVDVQTWAEGSEVVLRVLDNGIGITPHDQPHLFDRFYRVDDVRTHDAETGTGLGLSLVHEIVTAHHGTIHLESRPEHGTTVTVRLPQTFPGQSNDAQTQRQT